MTRTRSLLFAALLFAVGCADAHLAAEPLCELPAEEVEAPIYWTPCLLFSTCAEENGDSPVRPVQGSPCGPTYPDFDHVQCIENGPEGWAYAPGLRATVASSGACTGDFVESGYLQWRCGDARTCDLDARPCLPRGE